MADFDYSTLRIVARDLQFPEGPIAFSDGSLIVVEIEGASVARIASDGKVARTHCGGGPNGAAIGPDGAVYIGNDGGLAFKTEDGIRFPHALADSNEGGSIQRWWPKNNELETVFTESGGSRIGVLNDLVFDAEGGCYAVDTMRGCLHYFDVATNRITVAVEGLEAPNGAGLSPDGKTLYVSETYAGRIVAFSVTGAGTLADPREHYYAGGAHGFDGLAVDGAGNICAANLAASGISVISPEGLLLGAFVAPEHDPFITNVCFGGPDGDTAFICSAGRGILYSIRWPWPGLALQYAR